MSTEWREKNRRNSTSRNHSFTPGSREIIAIKLYTTWRYTISGRGIISGVGERVANQITVEERKECHNVPENARFATRMHRFAHLWFNGTLHDFCLRIRIFRNIFGNSFLIFGVLLCLGLYINYIWLGCECIKWRKTIGDPEKELI